MQLPALYSAFDLFPSPKGASTHIREMAGTLFDTFGGGMLYVLGDGPEEERVTEGPVEIFRLNPRLPNYLERALYFADVLRNRLQREQSKFEIVHFRDPWTGVVALEHCTRASYYEVNGLPSIELQSRFHLPARIIEKLRARELFCLERAGTIVVPSETIKAFLRSLGIGNGKIRVIPNGADIAEESLESTAIPGAYFLYFGALQSWQGVETALRAFSLLRDLPEVHFQIASASHRRMAKPYQKLAERLQIAERVIWHHGLPKVELRRLIRGARFTIAPLIDCERNALQGCCPLKILESMAEGVPVIASRLPCVEELMEENVHGLFVRPDRPTELARSMRLAIHRQDALSTMGKQARKHIEEHFSWERARTRLRELYESGKDPSKENSELVAA